VSDHNYFGIAAKANLEKTPDLMTVDLPAIEAKAAEHRAKMAELNPPKEVPAKEEFSKLRKQLYDLQQSAQGAEVRLKDARETVIHWEQAVSSLLKKRQAASIAMELGNMRGYEHNLVAAETDLELAKEHLAKWKKEHTQVGQTLRSWQTENGARLKELEKLV